MSLRTKAAIATVLVVLPVAGLLALFVSRLYTDAERVRIDRDLRREAALLRDRIDTARETSAQVLKNATQSAGFVELLARRAVDLTANLIPFVEQELTEATAADVVLLALDSFVAEERGVEDPLADDGTLAVCILHDRSETWTDEDQRRFSRDPGIGSLLADVFETNRVRSSVVAVGGRVYNAIAHPVYESLQEQAVPVGAAAVFIELTGDWLASARSGESGSRGTGLPPVHEGIHDGASLTAHTAPDDARARILLAAARRRPGTNVETVLDVDGSRKERHIARAEGFAPEGDGPGFVAFTSLDRALAPLRRMLGWIALAGALLAAGGCLAAYALAETVLRRLAALKRATIRIQEGDFRSRLAVRGSDEVTDLGNAFNDMTTGLEALGLYTDPAIARQVLAHPDWMTRPGSRVRGTVLFSDIRGFTPIAEKIPPDVLVERLNEYFTRLGRCIAAEGGYIDKFSGDAVMAYWGDPFVSEGETAARACRAALRMRDAAADLRAEWEKEGKIPFFQRIGIATGELIAGNIGSETKKNFTLIGDTVNLGSRLEGTNKQYGTEILVCAETVARAGAPFRFREVDRVQVKGKERPVTLYELLG